MTLKEMQELDLVKATTKQLEEAVKASYSLNKRIRNIAKRKNAYQGAVKSAMKSGGYFGFSYGNLPYPKESVSPQKYRAALQKEVARAQQFNRLKSSTVKGAREVYQNTVKTIFRNDQKAMSKFDKLSKKDKDKWISDFWSDYHRFQESNNYYPSDQDRRQTDEFTVDTERDSTGSTKNLYSQKNDKRLLHFTDLYSSGLRGEELFDAMNEYHEQRLVDEYNREMEEIKNDQFRKYSEMLH